MMNSDFALAVHSLVLLVHSPNKMETSKTIATSLDLHPVRVRNILGVLKKEDYIGSKGGPKGGFFLNSSPEDIYLDDIYRLTSQDTLKPKCHNCDEACDVGSNIEEVLDGIFFKAEEKLEEFLYQYTIQDVFNQLRKEYR